MEKLEQITTRQFLRVIYAAGFSEGVRRGREIDKDLTHCYGLDLECEMVAEGFEKLMKDLPEIITIK